eukprot:COSAG03_NODE_1928_length_3349_cov_1.712308_1_plen_81_part_00
MDGCAGVPHQTCGNNFGYKSCFKKPDMTCNTDQCWLWTVDVMAVCPEFFPDLSEQPPHHLHPHSPPPGPTTCSRAASPPQ